MSIERVVRPYQLSEVRPPRRVISASSGKIEPVILRIGRGGAGKQFNGSLSEGHTVYCESYINEKRN